MGQTVIYVSCQDSREIDVFALDGQSGELAVRQHLITDGAPSPMRVRPDAARLYVGLRHEHAVQAFAIAPGSGELSPLDRVRVPGAPVYLYGDPALRVLFSPSYADDNLSVIPLDAHGEPQNVSQRIQDLPRAHSARLDQTGRWLLVSTLTTDAIHIFRLTDDLRLVPNDLPSMLMRPGRGPRHVLFSADNHFVYCLNELDGSIDVLVFDAQNGGLTFLQTVSLMPAGFVGKPWAAELRLSPDGRFLYATERRSSTISAFAVNGASGLLSHRDCILTEQQPRGMDIAPSGRWLAAAGEISNHLTVYAVDLDSGRLTASQRCATGERPICVEIAEV